MAEESNPPGYVFVDEATEKLWFDYTISRFEEASRRVDDRRSWGRQLVIWIGVLVGLEANLFPKIAERLAKPGVAEWWVFVVLSLTAVVVVQLAILSVAVYGGYVAATTLVPERPTGLIRHIRDARVRQARVTIA